MDENNRKGKQFQRSYPRNYTAIISDYGIFSRMRDQKGHK
jgi:hypothetical protein